MRLFLTEIGELSFPCCVLAPRFCYGRVSYLDADLSKLLLQFLAAAGGTGWNIGRANQELEFSIAVLAIVSVKRHQILALLITVIGHFGLPRLQES